MYKAHLYSHFKPFHDFLAQKIKKNSTNVVVLHFLAVDHFDFTRKIVKKILGEKIVKTENVGVICHLIYEVGCSGNPNVPSYHCLLIMYRTVQFSSVIIEYSPQKEKWT